MDFAELATSFPRDKFPSSVCTGARSPLNARPPRLPVAHSALPVTHSANISGSQGVKCTAGRIITGFAGGA